MVDRSFDILSKIANDVSWLPILNDPNSVLSLRTKIDSDARRLGEALVRNESDARFHSRLTMEYLMRTDKPLASEVLGILVGACPYIDRNDATNWEKEIRGALYLPLNGSIFL